MNYRMNRMAKATEKAWQKGRRIKQKHQKETENEREEFLKEWELQEIKLENGCLIYRSKTYEGFSGIPTEEEDVII